LLLHNGMASVKSFFFTLVNFRRICNHRECTAPNGAVGINYATEWHCTRLSLPFLHIHLITCVQGFRAISFRRYKRIRKFRDTVTHSWYTEHDKDTGKYLIAKRVLMFSQFGGPLMIMLMRDTNCSYSIES